MPLPKAISPVYCTSPTIADVTCHNGFWLTPPMFFFSIYGDFGELSAPSKWAPIAAMVGLVQYHKQRRSYIIYSRCSRTFQPFSILRAGSLPLSTTRQPEPYKYPPDITHMHHQFTQCPRTILQLSRLKTHPPLPRLLSSVLPVCRILGCPKKRHQTVRVS